MSKSKAKGYRGEKEVEELGSEIGYRDSRRAWGSDGRSLGWTETVDNVWHDHDYLPNFDIQVKRRKSLPQWFNKMLDGDHDIVLIREDRGEWKVVLPLHEFIKTLRWQVTQKHSPTPNVSSTSPAMCSRRRAGQRSRLVRYF